MAIWGEFRRSVSIGLWLYLDAAASCPLFAAFTSQAGLSAVSPNQPLREYLSKYVAEGVWP
jgi:hypothetical protein